MDELDLVMLVISAVFLLPAAQQLIIGLGIVAGGLYNGDVLFISGPEEKLGIVVIVGMGQHGDVQAEGVTVGELAALSETCNEAGFGSGGVGVDHEDGRADDAKAAGLRNGGCKLRSRKPLHAALEDRIFDSEKLCDSCIHVFIVLSKYRAWAARSACKKNNTHIGRGQIHICLCQL